MDKKESELPIITADDLDIDIETDKKMQHSQTRKEDEKAEKITAELPIEHVTEPVVTAESLELSFDEEPVMQHHSEPAVQLTPKAANDNVVITSKEASPVIQATHQAQYTGEDESGQPYLPGGEAAMGGANKPPKKNKVLLVSLTIFVVLAAIIGSTMYLTKKTVIEIFDYTEVTFEGLNNEAIVTANIPLEKVMNEKDPKKAGLLEQLLIQLTYTYDDDVELSNGDIVTVKIDPNQPILKQLKIKPATTEKTYIVEGLATIPKTWEEVPNKEELIDRLNEQNDRNIAGYIERMTELAADIDSGLDMEVPYRMTQILYGVAPSKSCNASDFNGLITSGTCGTVIAVYEVNPIVHTPGIELNHAYTHTYVPITNIFIAEDGQIHYSVEQLDGILREAHFAQDGEALRYTVFFSDIEFVSNPV